MSTLENRSGRFSVRIRFQHASASSRAPIDAQRHGLAEQQLGIARGVPQGFVPGGGEVVDPGDVVNFYLRAEVVGDAFRGEQECQADPVPCGTGSKQDTDAARYGHPAATSL